MKIGPLPPVNRLLVLAAHTDDELGCAGTILRFLEQGTEVFYYALSRCENSVPEGFPKDVLERECFECTKRLGIYTNNVTVGRFEVRQFPRDRQAILELFIRLRGDLRPNLVLVPASSDIHQDHHTVYEEAFRAFKHSSILGYELAQNTPNFNSTAFVHVTDAHIDRKLHALSAYQSQSFRNYSSSEYVRSLARVRGMQCNNEYAEAFEVIRFIFGGGG